MRRTVRTGPFCTGRLILKHVPPRDISWRLEKPNNFSLLFFSYFCEDKFNNNNTNKRQKLAQDFLNSIDQTGELLAMFEDDEIDDVKQERMEVILFFYFHSSSRENCEIFHTSCWSEAFFILHIISLLHAFSFCPDGLKESYFHIFPIPSNVCWHLSMQAKEDYKRAVMDLSVCRVFVFPSCRKQILFINFSHAFFTIIFFSFLLLTLENCFNSIWGLFSCNTAYR